MSTTNENIIKAIDTIVSQKLGEINFDKTVVCEVLSANGNEYIVSDGNSRFTAYSDQKYIENQKVYVTIPQNNYSMRKLIIGTYTADGTKAYQFANAFEDFVDVTGNFAAGRLTDLTVEANSETLQAETEGNAALDYIIPTEQFGELNYIAFRATVKTKMPDVYTGSYGFILELEAENGEKHEYAFTSDEFYGNPYYYDEGYEVEKLFAYPAGVKFSRAAIKLYQKADFDEEANGKSIEASDFYLAFGYDQETFKQSSFIIVTEQEKLEYNSNNLTELKPIKAKYVEAINGTYKETTNDYPISWYRYRVGRPNEGAGIYWQKIYPITEQNQKYINQDGAENYATLKRIYEENLKYKKYLKEYEDAIQNLSKEENIGKEEYVNKSQELSTLYGNKLYECMKALDEEITLDSLKPDDMQSLVEQSLDRYNNAIKAIENSDSMSVLQPGRQYIFKIKEGEYVVEYFPSPNVQSDQVKAVINGEIHSNILTYKLTGTAPNPQDQTEVNAAIKLQLTNGEIPEFLVYGEDNKIIETYSGTAKTVQASFIDATEWAAATAITWRFPTNSLIQVNNTSAIESDGYTTITINKKNNELLSNELKFSLKQEFYPSLDTLKLECLVRVAGQEELATGSLILSFGRQGTSGTKYTLSLVDLNGQRAANYLYSGAQEPTAFKACLRDPNGQIVDLEGLEDKLNWEWAYEDNSKESTPINGLITDRNQKVLVQYLKAGMTNSYCNRILKLTYNAITIKGGETEDKDFTVKLVYYHPLGVTNIADVTGISGAREVVYNSNGTLISYDPTPYSIHGINDNDLVVEVVSQGQENLSIPSIKDKVLAPQSSISSIEGEFPWVCVTLTSQGWKTWQQPILMRYNNYGSDLIKNWDGETLKLNHEESSILASSFIAGKKNDNKFTGVVVGEVKDAFDDNENENKFGVFGYKEGINRFLLDQEGNFYVGKEDSHLNFKDDTFSIAVKDFLVASQGFEIKENSEININSQEKGNINIKKIIAKDFEISGNRFVVDVGDGTVSGTNIMKDEKYNTLGENISFKGSINRNGTSSITISNYGADSVWYNKAWEITAKPGMNLTFTYNLTTKAGWDEPYVGFCKGKPDKNGNYEAQSVTVLNAGTASKTFTVPNDNSTWYFFLNFPAYGVTDRGSLSAVSPQTYTISVPVESSELKGYKFQVTEEGQGVFIQPKINGGVVKDILSLDSSRTTSDQNLKNTITPLSIPYLNLLKSIQPVSYKYNNGTSDRLHTGFIAQQVEEALTANNLTSQDFAALVLDKGTGHYGLRYDEFIALNTLAIQDLYKYIELLEARIRELEKKED